MCKLYIVVTESKLLVGAQEIAAAAKEDTRQLLQWAEQEQVRSKQCCLPAGTGQDDTLEATTGEQPDAEAVVLFDDVSSCLLPD